MTSVTADKGCARERERERDRERGGREREIDSCSTGPRSQN